METLFFWIAWGIISVWALRTFYFSFSKEKLERLRKTSVGLTASVLVLTLLPWLPPFLGGANAVSLALGGNTLAILLFVLLIISLIFFFQKEYLFLKIAAVLTVLATLALFALMVIIRPGTFTLSLYDIAPIVAVLILLTLNVAVFLLWQQMQLLKKDEVVPDMRKKINAGIISAVILILGAYLIVSGGSDTNITSVDYTDEQGVVVDPKEGIEVFSQHAPGVVCFGENKFSFKLDTPYAILSDDEISMALTTDSRFVTVSANGESIEEKLAEFGMRFTKEGDIYMYEMPADGNANTEDEKTFGLSREKGRFLVSVFYTTGNEEQAKQILSTVLDSLQEGVCINE